MLADEIAAMHEVARGQCVFPGKLDVAAVAITGPPLILVLVATEADRHLGPQGFWFFDADLDVAAYTVAPRRRHVRAVLEFEMRTGELGTAAHVRFAMAIIASADIVRLGVATNAVGRLGKMNGVPFSGFSDALMAIEAPDTLEYMGAMFERMGRFSAQAEHAGTRRDEQRQHEQEGQARAHRKVRATRTRPFTSN